jgi:hypothetical protein
VADLAASHEGLGAVTSSEIRAQLERILASADFNVPEPYAAQTNLKPSRATYE